MTKGKTIFVSILLIVSAILIYFLMKDNTIKLDHELIDFFCGILFGVGIVIFIQILIKRKI
jgi:MFS-type transporter involved in bile tolerance (Atg22 family)